MKEEINMEQNTDGEQMSLIKFTRRYRNNIKGKYEIFGVLRAIDGIIEIYVGKKIGIRYL